MDNRQGELERSDGEKKSKKELSSTSSAPLSSMLSGKEREGANIEDMGNDIFSDITRTIFNGLLGVGDDKTSPSIHDAGNKSGNEVEKDINQERNENEQILDNAKQEMEKFHMDYDETNEIYDKYGMDGVMKDFNEKNPGADQDDRNEFAKQYGNARDAQDEIQALNDLPPSSNMEQHLEVKVEEKQKDLQEEMQEFQERHGANPDELIKNEMAKQGIDPKSIMTDEQFDSVATDIVSSYPEDQQPGVMKDLREYNSAYSDFQKAREQRDNYRSQEESREERSESQHQSHAERLNSHINSGHSNEGNTLY